MVDQVLYRQCFEELACPFGFSWSRHVGLSVLSLLSPQHFLLNWLVRGAVNIRIRHRWLWEIHHMRGILWHHPLLCWVGCHWCRCLLRLWIELGLERMSELLSALVLQRNCCSLSLILCQRWLHHACVRTSEVHLLQVEILPLQMLLLIRLHHTFLF